MTISAGRVEARFTIEGDDRSAAALKSVSGNLKRVRKDLKKTGDDANDFADKFAKTGDDAAGKAGKLSTALSSLGDFAGKSEGAFRHASAAAGAFDDVLTVLPGPVGMAAAAVAGLSTVLFLQARASRQARTQLQQAFGKATSDRLNKIREDLDVSAEAVIEYQRALAATDGTAFLLDGKLKQVVKDAEAIGEDGSEAVKRFAKELRSTATDAQLLAGRAAQLKVALSDLKLPDTFAGDIAAQAKEAQAVVDKQLDQLLKREKQGEDVGKERNALLQRRLQLLETLSRAQEERARNVVREAAEERKRVAAEQARIALQKRQEQQRKRQAAAAKARAAEQKRERAEAAAHAKEIAGLRREIAAEIAVEAKNEQAATSALQAKLRLLKATGAEAEQVRDVERKLADARADAALAAVLREENLSAQARDMRIESLRSLHAAELAEVDQRLEKESKAKRDKAKADAQALINISRDAAAGALQQSAADIAAGDDPAGLAFGFLSSTVGESVRQFGKAEDAAADAYTKIGQAGAQFISSEKGRAGLLAATSAADALRSAAQGNLGSAAMFGAAAVQYGLVAGGVVGGGGSDAPARGAAPLSGATATATPGGAAGTGRVVNVTFNGVFATKAQTAEALGEVMASINGTGL